MDSLTQDLPLTRSQTLILTGQRLQPDEPLYNMVLAFRIRGPLQSQLFQQAFNTLVARCDALRTVFIQHDEMFRQRLLEDVPVTQELIDLSSMPDREARLQEWINKRSRIMFRLDQRLFDSVLLKLGDNDHVWYLNQHHLLTDAWSMQVLYRKQQEFYRLARQGRLAEAQPLPRYRDYVARESQQQQSNAFFQARHYWRERLATPVQESQFYRQTPTQRSGRTRRLHCQPGIERTQKLRTLAQQPGFQGFTADLTQMQLFATVLLAYLHRMSGNTELSLGTPSHSRVSKELKNTVGLLIEIFPLKVTIEENETFFSLYKKVARANQELLMHALPGSTEFEHNRAFDVLLNYIPSSFGEFADMPAQSDWVHSGHGDRNHLLRLQVHDFDQSDEFSLHFDVNEDVFIGAERQWVLQHFLHLLDALLDDPDQPITAPGLLPENWQPPYQCSSVDWPANRTIKQTIAALLQQQAQRTPTATALVCGAITLSYQELAERSARVAEAIAAAGLQPGEVVAVCMPRSIEAVVAIVGVLKSTAVLLPLDPGTPAARLDFMLQDAGARLLLEKDYQLPEDSAIDREAGGRLQPPGLDNSAYILYTSGSTGAPKGVLVSQRSLSNYIHWCRDYYLDQGAMNFALFTSLGFDLTLTSLLLPLVSGGQLVIYPEPERASEITVRSVIEDNRVDALKLTPSHLNLIQSMDFSRSRLQKLIVGGEDFKAETARALSNCFGDRIDIYNEYGPTEATVACAVHKYSLERDRQLSVPIGKPISNASMHILDRYLNPVPQGVTGEIYIGGMGVARGYLNREQLTAERFIRDPRQLAQNLYRTGDLARYNHNGDIEYLGRNDQQVKIRGVRIETGEIAAVLMAEEGITAACVNLVQPTAEQPTETEIGYCRRCGLAGNHPSAQLDDEEICRICRIYERDKAHAQAYFRSLADLQRLIESIRQQTSAGPNCIMLLSGGKDSSYALCRLVDMGLTPIVFSLDNGFIADGAKANIRKLVDLLGLELVIGRTPAMNEIFADSLKRHSNVCNGCFKTIYTLSMNLARERGIRYICTGLSRGQIFETRVAHLFQQGIFDPQQVDQHIIEARKAYHRTEDLIARSLDVKIFNDDSVFEEIQYIDFYRYTEVTLAEVYDYLGTRVPWIRPSDTGRSTNCLINDVGIAVHKQERGYHNYALPYSWDVRLGHKQRNAALDELNDDLHMDRVDDILQQVGYRPKTNKLGNGHGDYLVAYYVAPSAISEQQLRTRLQRSLPPEFMPRFLVHLDALPLTDNGKLDRNALPLPDMGRRDGDSGYTPPGNATESLLLEVWSRMLVAEGIGVEDNFFELGGDSITNIQIVAAARESGIVITPQQIFDFPTIRSLAAVAGTIEQRQAQQDAVLGEALLLPSQLRYLEEAAEVDNQFNQSVLLQCDQHLDDNLLGAAIGQLLQHHDALRSRFRQYDGGWQQEILPVEASEVSLRQYELNGQNRQQCVAQIEQQQHTLFEQLDISRGRLLLAAHFRAPAIQTEFVLLVANHLVIDGVSWWIILSDLEALYRQLAAGETPHLAAKSTSIQQWANALRGCTSTLEQRDRQLFWLRDSGQGGGIPCQPQQRTRNSRESCAAVTAFLPHDETRQLLHDVPSAQSLQVPELLLTALLQALLPWTGTDELRVDMEGHGREDPLGGFNLLRTVGWFTSIYPVLLKLPRCREPGADLKQVKQQLRSIPLRGVEYGILRYLSADARLRQSLAQQPAADVLFNYMGQWQKNLSPQSHLTFARPIQLHESAHGQRNYLFEINTMVFDGRLQIEWKYSRNLYHHAMVEGLANDMLAKLRTLIGYCLSSEDEHRTPADFPAADLDQQGLDDLLAEFGE